MKLTAVQYKPMEPGDYRAKFTGYEEDEGEHGPFVKWYFEVLDAEYAGRSLRGATSTSFNPKSKMWAWVQALLGRLIEDGEEIDLDDLVGTEVIVHVEHQQNDRGNFERITGVRSVRKKREKTQEDRAEQDFDDPSF